MASFFKMLSRNLEFALIFRTIIIKIKLFVNLEFIIVLILVQVVIKNLQNRIMSVFVNSKATYQSIINVNHFVQMVIFMMIQTNYVKYVILMIIFLANQALFVKMNNHFHVKRDFCTIIILNYAFV